MKITIQNWKSAKR